MLDGNIERWNERYRTIEAKLREANALYLPQRPPPDTSPPRTESTAIVPATAQIDAVTLAGSSR